MVMVKLCPVDFLTKRCRIVGGAPSMVTDALSLRCANSPLTRTSGPQEEQISSAANAAAAKSEIPATNKMSRGIETGGLPRLTLLV